jgi:CRP-like cAMP-binding protein
LESGHCEKLVKGPLSKVDVIVNELHAGDIFGENSLLFNTKRYSSVRTKDHCTIGAMNCEAFLEMIKNFPEIKNRLK